MEHWPIACFELDGASDGSTPLQRTTTCRAINKTARELLGIRADDPAPAPLEKLKQWLPANELVNLASRWQLASDQGHTLTWQGQCLSQAPAKWIQLKAEAHEGRWHCVIADITEPKQLALNNESDLAQTALNLTEAIPVGTYTMVLEPGAALASFRFMSERFLELTGLDRETALSDPLKGFSCVHPDDYDAWVQLNTEAFTNRQPFFGETRLIVNGQIRWITAESIPRELSNGSVVWEGVLIDVTDRVQAQQQLQRNQESLEKLLNNIPVAIAIADFDTTSLETHSKARISFVNKTFERCFGYTLADVPTQEAWEILAYPDPDYRREVFKSWDQAMQRAIAQQGSAEQGEYRVQTKDGRSLRVLISAVALEDRALVAMVDVTDIRKAEQNLLESLQRERSNEEKLRKAAEEKLRVSLSASAVAHEIRQPLSSILMKSKMALKELQREEQVSEKLHDLITPLANEAQQMAVITDRISLLLRNVETELIELDLRDVVRSALTPLRGTLRKAAIEPLCVLPKHSCRLRGDAVQLQLAIANLVRNAVEAQEQAQTPTPQLQLNLKQEKELLELRISDNGPGFANTNELLLPLSSSKQQGSGIGLYVVRLTMENHGGSLQLGRSTELGGAEVILRLPSLTAGPTGQ